MYAHNSWQLKHSQPLSQVRVFFDSLEGYLLVWIPRHSLHLFDFSNVHAPFLGPSAFGEEAAPKNLYQPRNMALFRPSVITPFQMLLSQPSPSCQKQYCIPLIFSDTGSFMDCQTGTVYEYTWDKGGLLQAKE